MRRAAAASSASSASAASSAAPAHASASASASASGCGGGAGQWLLRHGVAGAEERVQPLELRGEGSYHLTVRCDEQVLAVACGEIWGDMGRCGEI